MEKAQKKRKEKDYHSQQSVFKWSDALKELAIKLITLKLGAYIAN